MSCPPSYILERKDMKKNKTVTSGQFRVAWKRKGKSIRYDSPRDILDEAQYFAYYRNKYPDLEFAKTQRRSVTTTYGNWENLPEIW
jgi:hypothetical protein